MGPYGLYTAGRERIAAEVRDFGARTQLRSEKSHVKKKNFDRRYGPAFSPNECEPAAKHVKSLRRTHGLKRFAWYQSILLLGLGPVF